jgi:hypothetical protein
LERRKLAQKCRVLVYDARNLRLLEHELRDQDVIRITCSAPGQVSRGLSVPRAQQPPEPEPPIRKDVRGAGYTNGSRRHEAEG